ncbi:MAG: M4 family metallopeptidase [Deltaproteobacteria bacterium]|nr:M4 family metallopeptidase [Deltaproteobacteria bacterium]
MARGAWWMVLGLIAGCSVAVPDEEGAESNADFYADHAAPTKAQSEELAQLGHVDAYFRPVTHDLALITGADLADANGDPAAAAVAFVAAHPAMFLGATVRIDSVRTISDGTIVRASQMAFGRRVMESGLVFAFDTQGALVEVAGSERFIASLPASEIPVPQAEDVARRYLEQATGVSALVAGITEPVIVGGRGGLRVELEAMPASGPTRRAIVIDDQSAEIIGDVEELRSVRAWGLGVAGEKRQLDVTDLGNGQFALVDPTRAALATYDGRAGTLPGSLFTTSDADRWDASGTAHGAAVDAQANAALFFDDLHQALIDASPEGHPVELTATVHFGQSFNGAFWDGAQAVFGDGDGKSFAPFGSSLDIVSHELAHGLVQQTAGLDAIGQSGALCEAVCDALSSFVQLHSGDPSQAWIIGGEVVAPGQPGGALRDLTDPQWLGSPDHLSGLRDVPADAAHDDGKVHENATIIGNAFFLMAEGGTNRTSGRSVLGIGADHAQHVLVHALTHGLTPASDFIQAARATIASANRLYGPSDAAQVQAAWEAVGVLVPTDDAVPSHDAGDGDDEPNDNKRDASAIELGQSISGVIATADDKDYFRFQLDAPRDVQLTLTGLSTDLDLRVYDVRGRIVARSERPGRADEVIHARAKKGAYDVKVYAPAGAHPIQAAYRLALQ